MKSDVTKLGIGAGVLAVGYAIFGVFDVALLAATFGLGYSLKHRP